MNPGKAPALARAVYHHGVSHHAQDPERRVGAFPDDDKLRIQAYTEHAEGVIVDPTAWIPSETPVDLGRGR